MIIKTVTLILKTTVLVYYILYSFVACTDRNLDTINNKLLVFIRSVCQGPTKPVKN